MKQGHHQVPSSPQNGPKRAQTKLSRNLKDLVTTPQPHRFLHGKWGTLPWGQAVTSVWRWLWLEIHSLPCIGTITMNSSTWRTKSTEGYGLGIANRVMLVSTPALPTITWERLGAALCLLYWIWVKVISICLKVYFRLNSFFWIHFAGFDMWKSTKTYFIPHFSKSNLQINWKKPSSFPLKVHYGAWLVPEPLEYQ